MGTSNGTMDRPAATAGTGRLRRAELEFWPAERQLWLSKRRVMLTAREYAVLLLLAGRERHVVSREAIYAEVWGGEMPHRDRNVDVTVRKVRTKLAKAAPGRAYVHTHHGLGYRFEAEQA